MANERVPIRGESGNTTTESASLEEYSGADHRAAIEPATAPSARAKLSSACRGHMSVVIGLVLGFLLGFAAPRRAAR
jgi:hypothetical protein